MPIDETFRAIYTQYDDLTNKNIGLLEKAQLFAEKTMDKNDLHGIGHIYRVIVNCHKILGKEEGDPFIVFIAAWLHDLGRVKDINDPRNHAIISSEVAESFLKQKIPGKDLSKDEISHILNCIESHSFSSGRNQETIEAEILSDADKIDAIGHIGVYRASCYQHDHGTGIKGMIEHFHEKLLILHTKLKTKTGKILGVDRTKVIRAYLNGLNAELSIS